MTRQTGRLSWQAALLFPIPIKIPTLWHVVALVRFNYVEEKMGPIQSGSSRCDGDSFSIELTKHIPALRSFAQVLTRNDECASDLTQETLMKAWQARASFAAGTNFRAWVSTIMRNQYLSEMRRPRRMVPLDEASAEQIPTPDGEQHWALELEDAARAIEQLSNRQRETLLLVGVGGFSISDAGGIMNCRITAVKSRLSRARRAVDSMSKGNILFKQRRDKRRSSTFNELTRQLEKLKGNAVLPAHAPGVDQLQPL